jgi:formate dehydrogenase maturation protein FdhE
MAQQTFFHETPHANYGVMFASDDFITGAAESIFEEIKAKADSLNQKNKNIFRVVAMTTPYGDGVQLFLAPHARYRELASDLLESFKYCNKAYIKDKNSENRLIRKTSFVERMAQIVDRFSNNKNMAIEKTIELIKSHYEKDITSMTKAIEKIASDFNMGTVKYQTYYAGLASTWLEYPETKKVA